MPVRQSEAEWDGDLAKGHGRMRLGSGAYEGAYSFASRFEDGNGTNPEELLAAAHAGCFSMALSVFLTKAGHPPDKIQTTAKVHLDKEGDGVRINRVELSTTARVPGIDPKAFGEQAEAAKENCPVSKLFRGAVITLDARLTA